MTNYDLLNFLQRIVCEEGKRQEIMIEKANNNEKFITLRLRFKSKSKINLK